MKKKRPNDLPHYGTSALNPLGQGTQNSGVQLTPVVHVSGLYMEKRRPASFPYYWTSCLKIPSNEWKNRLNNSRTFSGVRWPNKTLKSTRSMNEKIADWLLHTRRNPEPKCSFLTSTQGFSCTYNSHYIKCTLFFLPLKRTGICASLLSYKFAIYFYSHL